MQVMACCWDRAHCEQPASHPVQEPDVLLLLLLLQSTGLQVVEIAPRTSRGRFLMGHQLGVAFGTVLSAVLGFFVADQVRCLGWYDNFQSASGQSACVHATMTELNAGLLGGRPGAAVWDVSYCQQPICMIAHSCNCLQCWDCSWQIRCAVWDGKTYFNLPVASLHACT
jgi:hypothetical protein